jgi:alpha-tubulin suppressor-like RCC1 family protein
MRRASRIVTAACLAAFAALAFCAAASADGTVMGWGFNEDGQLGTGTASSGGCRCVTSPTAASISEVTQISASAYDTLGLLSDGTVEAWGLNEYGQLGDGSTTQSSSPVEVSGLNNAVEVASGTYYNSLALLADGTVVTWGENDYGLLGVGEMGGPETCGTYTCSKTPVPVPGLTDVVAIDAGYYYDLALLADGTVMAWGWDGYGSLGDAPKEDLEGCECIDHPVPVPGLSGVASIDAGLYSGSAVRTDGTVVDWGYNEYGELGDGVRLQRAGCTCWGLVQVPGVSGVTQSAGGYSFTLALRGDGSLSGWGYSEYDELGVPLENGCDCTATPMPVEGVSGPVAISAGGYHNVALMSDGTIQSWGYGHYGELGNGATPEKEVPTAVAGLSGASAVDASDYGSFAIIGASQPLTAKVAGSGQGTVGGERIVCPASACETSYPQGKVAYLRAEAAPGSTFKGFSGACTGTGVCRVTMDQARSVTATFEANPTPAKESPPSGTKIRTAKIDQKKRSASFSFEAAGTVTGFECRLVRPSSKKAPSFSKCSSPKAYKHLAPGAYKFEVRAFDSAGPDPNPARRAFRVKPAKHA